MRYAQLEGLMCDIDEIDETLAEAVEQDIIINIKALTQRYNVTISEESIRAFIAEQQWNTWVEESLEIFGDEFYDNDDYNPESSSIDYSSLRSAVESLGISVVEVTAMGSIEINTWSEVRAALQIDPNDFVRLLTILVLWLLAARRAIVSGGININYARLIFFLIILLLIIFGQFGDGGSALGSNPPGDGSPPSNPPTSGDEGADNEEGNAEGEDHPTEASGGTDDASVSGSEPTDSQNETPSNSAVPKPKTPQQNYLVNIQEIARLIAGNALPGSATAYTATALEVFKPPASLVVALSLLGLDHIFADRPIQISNGISAGKILGNNGWLTQNLPNLLIEWNSEVKPELRPALKATIGLFQDSSDKKESNAELVITLPATIDLKYKITGLPTTSLFTTSLTTTGLPNTRSTTDLSNTSLANTSWISPSSTNGSLTISDPTRINLAIDLPIRDPLTIAAAPIDQSQRDPSISNQVINDPAMIPSWSETIVVDSAPIASQPLDIDPLMTDPMVIQPSTMNVTIANPIATNLVVVDPVVTNSTVNPVVTDPNLPNTIVTNPTVANPIVINPTVANPVVTNPMVTDPILIDPTVANPLVTDPTVANPVVTNPVVTNPTVTNPTVTNPNVTNPNVTNPMITDPIVTDPTVANPNVTNPTVTDQIVIDPTVTNPVVTNPTVTDPTVTNPMVTDPTVANPIVTNPIVTDPIVTDPTVTNPIVDNPTITNNPPTVTNPSTVTNPPITVNPPSITTHCLNHSLIQPSINPHNRQHLTSMTAPSSLIRAVKSRSITFMMAASMKVNWRSSI
jgi:hypothetical protein